MSLLVVALDVQYYFYVLDHERWMKDTLFRAMIWLRADVWVGRGGTCSWGILQGI